MSLETIGPTRTGLPSSFAACTASWTSSKSAVGACGSPTRWRAVASAGTAVIATIRSPSVMSGWSPPQVPTRRIRLTPSMTSSSITIAADGQPIPLDCTDTGLPSKVPV